MTARCSQKLEGKFTKSSMIQPLKTKAGEQIKLQSSFITSTRRKRGKRMKNEDEVEVAARVPPGEITGTV